MADDKGTIASRMDPEQDVLVLMLTSHGSQDGLAVVNGTLPLSQLAPADTMDEFMAGNDKLFASDEFAQPAATKGAR